MPGNCLFRFRRRRSAGGRKDDTEITLSTSVVLIAVLMLAILAATGVIPPDVFARVMGTVLGKG